jgi:hypothetical protein
MMYISRIQLQQIHFMQATKTYHMHQFGNLDECVVSLDPDLILWFTKLLNMLVDLCLVLS